MIVEGCGGYILTSDVAEKVSAYVKKHTPPDETVIAVYVSPCYDEYAPDCVQVSWLVRKPPELVCLEDSP